MKRINKYFPLDNKPEVKNMAKDKPRDTSLDQWICESDPNMMIVLNRFKVEIRFYREVKWRLSEMRYWLIKDVEYKAEDLMWGDVFDCFDPAKFPMIVLCIKHIAAQPNALIREVRWGIFMRSY